MSAVVKFFSDVADAIVTLVVAPVVILTVAAWEYIGYPVLEASMGVLGIKDEDIVSTKVITQRIIADTAGFNASMTKLALLHQDDPNGSVIEHYVQIAQQMRGKLGVYFDKGKNNSKGLPYTNIRSMVLPTTSVQTSVDTYAGETTIIESVKKAAPSKMEWVGFNLQDTHSYKPYTDKLLINTDWYTIKTVDYNYDTDVYDVYCEYIETIKKVTTTTTTITITNIDATNDNKNTTVTKHTVETSDVNGVISDTSTEISSVDETIPIGTESTSTSESATTSYIYNTLATTTLTVASFVPELYAITKWYKASEDSTQWYYWLYKIGEGTYPDIDTSSVSVGAMELMPIVTLRNNFVNTNADKTSTKYLESKELLEALGVDIDELTTGINDSPDIASVADAFVYLGVDLRDDTPEINKLVYETFSQLYEGSGLYSEEDKANASEGDNVTGGYSATIQEMPYNIVFGWKHQKKEIVAGSIGPVGTYEKSVSDNDLIMSKQTAPGYYTVYTMTSVTSVTFIDRQGVVGTIGKNLSDGIDMPLGFFFLDSLDAAEQMRIFPYVLKLSIYAAQLIHLEWYETEAFASILKIISIIAAVIITIITLGAASTFGAFLISMAEMLVVGVAVGWAMNKLMESGAPDWLKAAGAIVLVVVSIWLGGGRNTGEFLTATQLTSAVTTASASVVGTASAAVTGLANALNVYTQIKINDLNEEAQNFKSKADLRQQVIDDAFEHLKDGLDVTDIQWLMDKEYPEAYLRGPDAFMYRAKGEIQYDYAALYDYNVYKDDYVTARLQLGIV